MRRAEDVIPSDILEAARAAGLSTPLWYVGRSGGHRTPTRGLGAAVQRARREAGLAPARLVSLDPQQDGDRARTREEEGT